MQKMHDNMPREISKLAVKALLYEVSATPKPGLVDRVNNGAHRDMDFYTFIDSSVSLGEYFYKISDFILKKYESRASKKSFMDPADFFGDLQKIGIEAETLMYRETNGVNTHKGAIYAFGLITCAATEYVWAYRDSLIDAEDFIDKITKRVSEYVNPVVEEQLSSVEEALTYGERQYRELGLKGARGEAASGYLSAKKWGLPIITKAISKGKTLNDAMVQALLVLICHLEDSNVIGRHHYEMLKRSQIEARKVLEVGGIYSETGWKAIRNYDLWCIEQNVSHGGCADLLAVSVYLKLLSDNLCI